MIKAETVKWIIDVIILPIVIYGVTVLSSLNKTMAELNTTVGILSSQDSGQEKRIDKLEHRVFGN